VRTRQSTSPSGFVLATGERGWRKRLYGEWTRVLIDGHGQEKPAEGIQAIESALARSRTRFPWGEMSKL